MKTIFCWLIANIESHIALMILFVLFYYTFLKKNENLQKMEQISSSVKVSEAVVLNYAIGILIIAFILAILTAIFTYQNFDEVISRQFKWRSSNVGQFSAQLSYTFSRFFWSMVIYCIYLCIILYKILV